ncbi:MAG: hypothetical protein M3451_09225 [Chloroflexota bacterium]|nr:hypothetical protein [Chloroflexota bacterium]
MRSPILAPRATGLTILGIGMMLMLFALLADVIGVGGGEGFGYQQLIVLIIGVVLALGGGAMMAQAGKSASPTGNDYRPDADSGNGF